MVWIGSRNVVVKIYVMEAKFKVGDKAIVKGSKWVPDGDYEVVEVECVGADGPCSSVRVRDRDGDLYWIEITPFNIDCAIQDAIRNILI